MDFSVIGRVKNKFVEPAPLDEIREEKSTITIKSDYEEGLYKIEKYDYLQIIFYFDRSNSYKLKAPRHSGEVRGVFASRSPNRPSGIGVTTVQLIERKGNRLIIRGIDALDGTPVLDIKPYSADLIEADFFTKISKDD